MVLQVLLIQNFVTLKTVAQIAECPPTEVIPGCPCYNFEDGLFLECAGATEETLRTTLQGLLSTSGKQIPFPAPVKDEKEFFGAIRDEVLVQSSSASYFGGEFQGIFVG